MKRRPYLLLFLLVYTAGWIRVAQATETHSFLSLNRAIPDGNVSGLSDHQTVVSAITSIAGLRVKLHVAGEFNGDLYGYVRLVSGTTTNFCVLLNRSGRTAAIPWGYADSGLNVTFDDAAANGNIHLYHSVVSPPAGTPLSGTWRPDGRNVDPSSVLDTTGSSTSLAGFNGTNPSGDWTLFLADVDSGATNMLVSWELEITGGSVPNVIWASPASITYGTPLSSSQLNASSSTPGTYVYDPPAGTLLNAGAPQALSVTFTPTDTTSYVPVTQSVSINVMPATLSIGADRQSKVYGAVDPTLTYTVSGLQGADTQAGVLTGSLARAAGTTVAGSPYAITQGTLAADANYTVSFSGNTLAIIPANTAGTVVSSVNPAMPGQSVALVHQVNAVAPGAGVPTGSAQFFVDGTVAGAPVPLNDGVAILTLTTLLAGLHSITAVYAGDDNFKGTTNTLTQAQLVNTPPVAGADTILRYPTEATKVLVSTLLSNDADADGNPLQWLSVSAGSTHGATLTRDGDWIHYTPPSGFTNDDSFTYAIADRYGASATGTVSVLATTDAVPAANLVLKSLGGGSLLLSFDGIPGRSYRIEYSAFLPTWLYLGSAVASDTGVFEYVDTAPPGTSQRFYRSVYP